SPAWRSGSKPGWSCRGSLSDGGGRSLQALDQERRALGRLVADPVGLLERVNRLLRRVARVNAGQRLARRNVIPHFLQEHDADTRVYFFVLAQPAAAQVNDDLADLEGVERGHVAVSRALDRVHARRLGKLAGIDHVPWIATLRFDDLLELGER